jgi:hypothetical protein
MNDLWKGIAEKVILAILGSFGGYMLGTSETNTIRTDLMIIKADMRRFEDHLGSRDRFIDCAKTRLDRLEGHIQAPPNCAGEP